MYINGVKHNGYANYRTPFYGAFSRDTNWLTDLSLTSQVNR